MYLTYQAQDRGFSLIIKAKQDNLLTLGAFEEMIQLEQLIMEDVSYEMSDIKSGDQVFIKGGYQASYSNVC